MKKKFTIIFMTMFLFVLVKPMFGQVILNTTISPSNLTDCTPTYVTIFAQQNCINHVYNGSSHTINGNVVTITLSWSSGPICQGALSQVQANETITLPSGTVTLDIVTLNNGALQNSTTQQLNVTPCCPVQSFVQGNGSTNICIGESATLVGSSTNSTSAYWSLNGINISNNATLNLQPTTSGSETYYYVATDGNCSDSTAHVLITNNYPNIDLGEDTTVCVGQTVVLSAAGGVIGTTYTWSTGASSVNYTTNMAGTYSVVASKNGCTDTDTITISNAATPTFNLGSDTVLCDGSSVILDATAGAGVTYSWSDNSTMPTLNVSAAGNYQVTATNSIGCFFTDDITISYQSIPMPNLGNDTTLCSGSAITLTASTNPTGILWSTGSIDPVIIVNSAGVYTVTITTDGGCAGSDDIVVDYSSVAVDLGDTLDLVNGTITLDAENAGSTYSWNTGETSQTIDVDSTGSYNVTVVDIYGCSAAGSVVIINTTSTNGLMTENFKVYPNPANQYIVVEANGTAVTMARIINMTGQIVGTVNVQNQEQISVEHLTNGIYFLQFSNRDGEIVGQTKFIKQ